MVSDLVVVYFLKGFCSTVFMFFISYVLVKKKKAKVFFCLYIRMHELTVDLLTSTSYEFTKEKEKKRKRKKPFSSIIIFI